MTSHVLMITTAYEQGVGTGHFAHHRGAEIGNPYADSECHEAWARGYAEGKLQASRSQPTSDLNLADKSVQKRLATQWGFVPKQQPLTVEQINALLLTHGRGDDGFHGFARAIERAHGIGGEA